MYSKYQTMLDAKVYKCNNVCKRDNLFNRKTTPKSSHTNEVTLCCQTRYCVNITTNVCQKPLPYLQ